MAQFDRGKFSLSRRNIFHVTPCKHRCQKPHCDGGC